jgi:O-acetyl-ADP-ribose deacetylase (regulator of RNase III)
VFAEHCEKNTDMLEAIRDSVELAYPSLRSVLMYPATNKATLAVIKGHGDDVGLARVLVAREVRALTDKIVTITRSFAPLVFKFLKRKLDDNALDIVLKRKSNGVALRFGVTANAATADDLDYDSDGFAEIKENSEEDGTEWVGIEEHQVLSWCDEHGGWHSYDEALGIPAKVALARATGVTSLPLVVKRGLHNSHGQRYTIDLKRMVQINDQTKVTKQVRWSPSPPLVQKQPGRRATAPVPVTVLSARVDVGSTQASMLSWLPAFGRPGTASVELSVEFGDILQTGTEAIINPANERLQHLGGLAHAISKAAGRQALDSECMARLRSQSSPTVPTGGTVTTSACGLKAPIKHIVHAVGPRYTCNSARARSLMRAAVSSALDEAEAVKASSVALPIIGGGIFGWPADEAAQLIVGECVQWVTIQQQQKKKASIRKIVLCDVLHRGVQALVTAVEHIASSNSTPSVPPLPPPQLQLPPMDPPHQWSWKEDDGTFVAYDDDHRTCCSKTRGMSTSTTAAAQLWQSLATRVVSEVQVEVQACWLGGCYLRGGLGEAATGKHGLQAQPKVST